MRFVRQIRPKYQESKSINWEYNLKIYMDYVEDYARQRSKQERGIFLNSLWLRGRWYKLD